MSRKVIVYGKGTKKIDIIEHKSFIYFLYSNIILYFCNNNTIFLIFCKYDTQRRPKANQE